MMGKISNSLLGAAALLAGEAMANDFCHALVLSGGGNNGAWESGVIWGLINYGDPTDY